MTVTQVQVNSAGTGGATGSLAVTLASGITQGNVVTVTIGWGDTSGALIITPPDGSWVQAAIRQSTAFAAAAVYYLVVDAGHAGQTSWTWGFNNAHNGVLTAAEWNSTTGWPASALTDKTATNLGSGTAVDSGTTATTASAQELWIAALMINATGAWSGVTAGWSSTSHNSASNSLLTAWQAVSTTGTADVGATNATSAAWGGAIATLTPVQGGGGGGGTGITVGTTPVQIAGAAVHPRARWSGSFRITNGAAAIYLGGPNVTPSNGFQVAAGATWPPAGSPPAPLFPGDQVWACTASSTSTVLAFQTGGG